MSLKDEISKLVEKEREKLSTKDQKDSEFKQRQIDRFSLIVPIINEILESVGEQYLGVELYDDNARLKVGELKDSFRAKDLTWKIYPNYKFDSVLLQKDEPGYKIDETRYYHDEIVENNKTFINEQELSEYLIKEVSEKVARYLHYKEKYNK